VGFALLKRNAIRVYPNAEGIRWFGTRWTDDGMHIEIYNSRAQVYASKLMVINPDNPIYTNHIQTLEKGNIRGNPLILFVDALTEFIGQSFCGDSGPMKLDAACQCLSTPRCLGLQTLAQRLDQGVYGEVIPRGA
jgi:hypothetical protein